jgi:hypothetical protein
MVVLTPDSTQFCAWMIGSPVTGRAPSFVPLFTMATAKDCRQGGQRVDFRILNVLWADKRFVVSGPTNPRFQYIRLW